MLPESCLSFIASTNRGNWSLVPLFTPHFPSSCSSLQLSYWVERYSEGETMFFLVVSLFDLGLRHFGRLLHTYKGAWTEIPFILIVGAEVWSPYLQQISRILALISSFHSGLKMIVNIFLLGSAGFLPFLFSRKKSPFRPENWKIDCLNISNLYQWELCFSLIIEIPRLCLILTFLALLNFAWKFSSFTHR